jgi:hypothetical protein
MTGCRIRGRQSHRCYVWLLQELYDFRDSKGSVFVGPIHFLVLTLLALGEVLGYQAYFLDSRNNSVLLIMLFRVS